MDDRGDSVDHNLIVENDASDLRVDVYLAEKITDVSRSRLKFLIQEGLVLVNDNRCKSSHRLRTGDIVQISIPAVIPLQLQSEEIPLEILFEDSDVIVLSKPQGMVVHPGAGINSGTLVHALLFHCGDLSGIGGVERPGIVHRLDKGTSGVIIVAKNDLAHESLTRQFANRETQKQYFAVVAGSPGWDDNSLSASIGRHTSDRKRMAVNERGRDAYTDFQVRARGKKTALVSAWPKTGRTHQIRVHLKHLGLPILGDEMYGAGWQKRIGNPKLTASVLQMNGMCLHAYRLQLRHPRTKVELEFVAPFPESYDEVFKHCGFHCDSRSFQQRKAGPE